MRTTRSDNGRGTALSPALAGAMLLAAVLVAACGGGGAEAGAGGAAASSAELEKGRQLYRKNCSLCHGYDGEGVERLGKPIVDSAFVGQRSDEELVRFLIEGRAANHPDNTQGVPMPPRGGNPGLTDEDLAAIVAYMRSLS